MAALLLLGGCAAKIPKDALQMAPESLERRQLQTRRFDGIDEKSILQASAGVLQDVGFNLDESETRLGLIVASKERSAMTAGQVILAVIAAGFGASTPIDKTQKIRVSLVARPASPDVEPAEATSFLVRVTFQRIIRDINDRITRIEAVDDPAVYREFFEKLSKSVFLEAHEI